MKGLYLLLGLYGNYIRAYTGIAKHRGPPSTPQMIATLVMATNGRGDTNFSNCPTWGFADKLPYEPSFKLLKGSLNRAILYGLLTLYLKP